MYFSDRNVESFIASLPFIEEIYQRCRTAPHEVDPAWHLFFRSLENKQIAMPAPLADRKERILHLMDAYARHGHLMAKINPIALKRPEMPPQLLLESLGFKAEELQELFPTCDLLPLPEASLQHIIECVQKRYAQSVGFEFKGYLKPDLESWIQDQIATGRFEKGLTLLEKQRILDILTKVEAFEVFLHMKHVGKKRFSLEGGETLIPMLAAMIEKCVDGGTEEVVIGMSHRGRLNVLAHILNKPLNSIFQDFDDDYEPTPSEGMGDIRYHKGHANGSMTTYHGKKVCVTMLPNPSHLESIDPVLEGQVHAKQFLAHDEETRNKIVPFLIHGDGAFAGQGVVYETLQMNQLPGFQTGGTVHVVVNNQIGFTTSPEEGRSTLYCTDIAKTFGIPVFHLNAENPEMCVKMALFAMEIRNLFHSDVFLDLNCYRKYGHNEGDEPAFTQPLEYHLIRDKQSIRRLYLDQLIEEGVVTSESAKEQQEAIKKDLQEAYQKLQEEKNIQISRSVAETVPSSSTLKTGVEHHILEQVAAACTKSPSNFHLHPKLKSLFEARFLAVKDNKSVDWGTAELLAYGTLLLEETAVRLVGQDSGRGTFSHRHALWVDQVNNQAYYPLAHLSKKQGRFEVINTILSESAAVGFEYGYSTVCLESLNIWEAQFGDFVNSAQVMIDQYISSGEQKWGQRSNLVLFLPHGFEGQGPEHSSARFERFLALAGHDNMRIVNPTTPAQLFHLLRLQVKQKIKKPLVVLTPKGLLRHPSCVSEVKELTDDRFHTLLDDPESPKKSTRLILCSGRIYYDLIAERKKTKQTEVAIVRLEQLYPLDILSCQEILSQYQNCKECLWVQEEPKNMGAWPYISFLLAEILPKNIPFSYVGRGVSATPATGFYSRHAQELQAILSQGMS